MHLTGTQLADIASICLGLLALALVLAQRIEFARLQAFAKQQTIGCLSDQEAALHLAQVIHSSVRRSKDPYFLLPIFGPLGGAPMRILERGGCCSGIHRLYITALDAIGIRAAQITLYHRHGHAQHCLTEVRLDGGQQIIDVDYGVRYHDGDRHSFGLEELRGGIAPRIEPFANSERAGYPNDAYYDFNFRQTRTANWTKSAMRRIAYSGLSRLTRGKVDRFFLPPILEWPHTLVAILLLLIVLILQTARLLIG